MKFTYIILLGLLFANCTNQNEIPMEKHMYTNDLIKETSPYLLQHAHNPVDWKPWNENVLNKAKKENKLIIISIGYAACHWCHVMEHESFEDPKVAELMNTHYINIKVDREERPDIDQVYMSAVQLMTGSGGWPLNMIALPDGRPVWGGTYFKKEQWIEALKQITKLYTNQPEKLIEYAHKLEQGIKAIDVIEPNTVAIKFEQEFIASSVKDWSTYFDYKKGGTKRVPKFMMPNNYHFLYRYAHQTNNNDLLKYVNNTLKQISYGGVYDHIGGGFARYSTDDKWHVPHFEKMLYDNAQLVSLYSDAYLTTKNQWYKDVVYETLAFVSREFTNNEGAFFSSLDADSTNENGILEEGAFYVWKKDELSSLLKDDYNLFSEYYNINKYGLWEKGNYVLIRKNDDTEICNKYELTNVQLRNKVYQWKKILLQEREKRSRPRLDDKTLTSWNALMLKGYLDAYSVFDDPTFLDAALKNANFIKNKQLKSDNSLFHNYKNGKSTINGYLEDYATVIDAFIALYQNTFDQQWIDLSEQLLEYTFDHFYDADKTMFYFTSDKDPKLITRTIEHTDNVIPASNSIMAKNLFKLYHYTNNQKYLDISQSMLHTIIPQIENYTSGYSNWLDLMLNYTDDFYEVVIIGKEAISKQKELNKTYIPNKLIAGSISESKAFLLANRYINNKTLLYICIDNTCKFPVETTTKAILLMD